GRRLAAAGGVRVRAVRTRQRRGGTPGERIPAGCRVSPGGRAARRLRSPVLRDLMTRVLAPALAWVGGRFTARQQIAIGSDGRIEAVGELGRNEAEALRDVALLPGFVDAHSHAFQRGLRGRGETFPRGAGSF